METSAQRIAEISSRALRNISRNENNRTTIYKAKFKLAVICGFTGSLPLAAGVGDEGRAGVDVNPASGGANGLPSLGLELLLPRKGGGASGAGTWAAAGGDDGDDEDGDGAEFHDPDDDDGDGVSITNGGGGGGGGGGGEGEEGGG